VIHQKVHIRDRVATLSFRSHLIHKGKCDDDATKRAQVHERLTLRSLDGAEPTIGSSLAWLGKPIEQTAFGVDRRRSLVSQMTAELTQAMILRLSVRYCCSVGIPVFSGWPAVQAISHLIPKWLSTRPGQPFRRRHSRCWLGPDDGP